MHASTRLSAHPTSPAAARRFVRDVLQDLADEPVLLCTDELVTNAIVHVCSDVELVVRRSDDGTVVRVEVHDASPRPPLRRVPSPEDEHGRGLMLVEALSTRWGVDRGTEGKAVWFEVGEVS